MKFPQAICLEVLWRAYLRTGIQQFLQLVTTTMDACCWAASTIMSAAASSATPSTSAGWCRISRRCCTTMPC